MNLISPRDGEDKKKFCYLEFSSNFVNGKKQQQQKRYSTLGFLIVDEMKENGVQSVSYNRI